MSETVAERKAQRRNVGNARKLDRELAREQAERGLTNQEIADSQGVDRTTVWRFMDSLKAERRAIEDFRANRADVFARLQGKAIDLQFRIIESFDDGVLASLTPSQKTALAMSLNAVVGTIYDKERLETGKSTENVSLLTRMLDSAQDQVFKNQRVTEK